MNLPLYLVSGRRKLPAHLVFLSLRQQFQAVLHGGQGCHLRLALTRLHRAVQVPNVPVDDPDALRRTAGIFHAALPNLDALDEQSSQLRRQLVDGGEPLGLLNERFHVGGGRFQLLQPVLLFRDGLLQHLLLGVIIGGEHLELPGGDPLEDVILIEPLEQHRQLPIPLPHGVQLLLERIHLPAQFLAVLLVDVRRELPLLHPGKVGHPPEVIQHDLAQLILPDMVCGTRSLAPFPVGVARVIIPRLFHRAGPVEHHGLAAVLTEGQPREDIRLIHLFRDALLVLAHVLHDVPLLLGDQRRVGVLHCDLLTLRSADQLLVFVGKRSGSQSHRMPQVDPVVQDARHAAAAPIIGPGGVHMVVGLPLFLVGVVGGRQDLLVRQDAGDLVGAFAAGAQVEDALHHRRGFLVGDDLLAVRRFPAVAVGRPAAETLTALRLELFHRPNLFAGILGVQLICPVSDGIEVGAALHQGVHRIQYLGI